MTTFGRLVKNLLKVGPANALRQLNYIGDIKAGTLVGTDAFGNKYYENNADEIYGRERWVDYASSRPDGSMVPPEWHMWMNKIVQEPPTTANLTHPKFEAPFTFNATGSPRAYRPYNTTKAKVQAWQPEVTTRQ